MDEWGIQLGLCDADRCAAQTTAQYIARCHPESVSNQIDESAFEPMRANSESVSQEIEESALQFEKNYDQ
jgi:hypothetical protein